MRTESDPRARPHGGGFIRVLDADPALRNGVPKLYHFGARYYDFFNARWTQLDPLLQYGDLRQATRYTYAGGDLVNIVDRSGLDLNECFNPLAWAD